MGVSWKHIKLWIAVDIIFSFPSLFLFNMGPTFLT